MEIISFEEAKAKRQLKEKITKPLLKTDDGESELMKPYYELVQLCEKFYGVHD